MKYYTEAAQLKDLINEDNSELGLVKDFIPHTWAFKIYFFGILGKIMSVLIRLEIS